MKCKPEVKLGKLKEETKETDAESPVSDNILS